MKKLLLAAVLMIIMIMFTGCDSDTIDENGSDNTSTDGGENNTQKPKITSPVNGSTVTVGDTILIETGIQDPDDIDHVQFWINDGSSTHAAFTDYDQPFEFNWTPTSPGSYKIWIKTRDTSDNPLVSYEITVIVNDGGNNDNGDGNNDNGDGDDTLKPEITFPDHNSTFTVGDTILIETYLPHPNDIDVVRFWMNYNNASSNAVVFTDNSKPFEFDWTPTSPGTYKIWIKALDTANNPIVSEKITVIINADGNNNNNNNGGNTAGIGQWENYGWGQLPYIRMHGFQKIKYTKSQAGTSEFLILSASHGNPPASQIKYPAEVKGGGWTKVAYAGNDDKSTEIWFRKVTASNKNTMGELDSKNAAAKFAILIYKGLLSTGNVTTKNQLKNANISIKNSGNGPFLVVASSDNGGESKIANKVYGYKSNGNPGDDMTFIYLTNSNNFVDNSVKIRGAIANIQLQ